ncbi:Hsp70 family protein [Amycolatopsis sacchari]|uniref:Hsp70 family protein n=1 Tax=Amycolatopsis sacchari TaxID=115433 RepID=UPI003EBA7D81
MRYVLGIDLGGTRIKAAVCRRAGEVWGEPEVVCSLESVLHVAPDATVVAGPEARRRALAEPGRSARGFARRIGDDVPLLLGDELYRPEALTAVVAGWVADEVAEAEGAEADRIALTHPPGWGGHRRRLLHEALAEAGLPGALLLPTPIAAAESLFVRERVEPCSLLGVCRLGGEYVDTALLRRAAATFELVSSDEQLAPPLDDVLTEHAVARFGGEAAQLHDACVEAKELLSSSPEVDLPGRLTRTEFERLAEPYLRLALTPLRRYEQLSAALLVGGTARIPLAGRLAEEVLNCRVVVDPDPATAACRGAALAARPPAEAPPASTALVPRVTGLPELEPEEVYDPEPSPPRPPVVVTPLEPPRRRFVPTRRSGSRDEDDE